MKRATERLIEMPDRRAIERGFAFEHLVNAVLGLRRTPGSGNKWHARGDGSGGGIVVESKAQDVRSWADVKRLHAEAVEESQGSGDLPVLALMDADDGQYVVMSLADFTALRTELKPIEIPESKAQARQRRAAVPALLREEG